MGAVGRGGNGATLLEAWRRASRSKSKTEIAEAAMANSVLTSVMSRIQLASLSRPKRRFMVA